MNYPNNRPLELLVDCTAHKNMYGRFHAKTKTIYTICISGQLNVDWLTILAIASPFCGSDTVIKKVLLHTTWRQAFQWFVIILLGISLVTLSGYTKIGKNAFYVLSIVSLIYILFNWRRLPPLRQDEKIFFSIVVIGFIWTLITFYLNNASKTGNILVWSRQVNLLLMIPLYYLFLSIRITYKTVMVILVLASIVTFSVAVYDVYYGASANIYSRASGGTHPILFASFALSLCGCILSWVIYGKNKFAIQLIGLIAMVLFCIAVILSKSRGVWLGIPLLFIMGFGYGLTEVSAKTKMSILIASMLSLSLIYFIPVVQNRIDLTLINVENYINSKSVNDSTRSSSLGTRFEMWKAGWKMFKDSPIFGVGLGGYQERARENLTRYNVNASAASFYHPHNQFISALATRGIPGLVFVMSLMLFPVYMFYKVARRKKTTLCYVFAGNFIVLSYLIYSITDVPLEGKPTILLYTVTMAFILAKTSGSSGDSTQKI